MLPPSGLQLPIPATGNPLSNLPGGGVHSIAYIAYIVATIPSIVLALRSSRDRGVEVSLDRLTGEEDTDIGSAPCCGLIASKRTAPCCEEHSLNPGFPSRLNAWRDKTTERARTFVTTCR